MPSARRDTGDDLDRQSRASAGRDLLGSAAEYRGAAALEPHHAPAGLGECDHQRSDLVLPARRTSLADQHRLCLAPSEVEHLRREVIIDQNDVSRLQRPHRAQREQLGIAGAGADQRHAAGAGGRDLVLGRAHKRIEIGRRGFALRIVHRKARERLPEPPPGG